MRGTSFTVGCLSLAASVAAGAQGLDGSRPMLCAAMTAVVCEQYDECTRGPAERINLPVFWRVDPAAKTVESTRGGEKRTSRAASVVLDGSHIVLVGSDGGFGWSATISKETGRMLLSGGRDEGYLVFGACEAI